MRASLLATDIALPAGLGGVLLFITVYSVIAPWWRTPVGRVLVQFTGSVVLLLGLLVARHPFGISTSDSVVFSWFQAAAGVLIAVSMTRMTFVLLRVQRRRGGGRRGP